MKTRLCIPCHKIWWNTVPLVSARRIEPPPLESLPAQSPQRFGPDPIQAGAPFPVIAQPFQSKDCLSSESILFHQNSHHAESVGER